jgi:tetratricopeptide (TPR) repeat protein
MRRISIVLAAGLGLAALSLWLSHNGIDSARDAYAAFQRGDYSEAVRAYQRSAETCHDLQALAANQAAALYRLDLYGDADARYELATAGSDALQSAKAQYDRGNCKLRQTPTAQSFSDTAPLTQAAEQFRACLALESTLGNDEKVFVDARHNLELTKLLQQTAKTAEKTDVAARNESESDPQTNDDRDGGNRLPMEIGEPSRDKAPVASESRKPSNLLASLAAQGNGSDYLCPD